MMAESSPLNPPDMPRDFQNPRLETVAEREGRGSHNMGIYVIKSTNYPDMVFDLSSDPNIPATLSRLDRYIDLPHRELRILQSLAHIDAVLSTTAPTLLNAARSSALPFQGLYQVCELILSQVRYTGSYIATGNGWPINTISHIRSRCLEALFNKILPLFSTHVTPHPTGDYVFRCEPLDKIITELNASDTQWNVYNSSGSGDHTLSSLASGSRLLPEIHPVLRHSIWSVGKEDDNSVSYPTFRDFAWPKAFTVPGIHNLQPAFLFPEPLPGWDRKPPADRSTTDAEREQADGEECAENDWGLVDNVREMYRILKPEEKRVLREWLVNED